MIFRIFETRTVFLSTSKITLSAFCSAQRTNQHHMRTNTRKSLITNSTVTGDDACEGDPTTKRQQKKNDDRRRRFYRQVQSTRAFVYTGAQIAYTIVVVCRRRRRRCRVCRGGEAVSESRSSTKI